MATKTITVTEEAYNRLARLKKENESFSEIITRVTSHARLKDFFGILSKESADRLERAIEEGRKEHAQLHEKRHKSLMKELS